MNPGATRRDAKEATRLALVRAAIDLFTLRGFDGPSLDAICARAGYTRGAFYVHFKDRDELIAAAMRHALDHLLDDVIASGDGGDDIERTVMRFVDYALQPQPTTGELVGPLFHQTLEACRRSEEVRRMFVGVLADAIERVASAADTGQRTARLRTDVSPAEIASLLVILALGARVAMEVELPIDVAGTRDAALQLLRPPPPAKGAA
jgi:AcrR family transcriptional regulator